MRLHRIAIALILLAAALLLAAQVASARCLDEDCRAVRPTATWAPLWTATPAPAILLDVAPMTTDVPAGLVPSCPATPPPKGSPGPAGLCVSPAGPVTRPPSATPPGGYP